MSKLSTAWKSATDTLISLSVILDSTIMTKGLLSIGADPNAEEGLPLRIAGGNKDTKILKALLNAGANVGLDDSLRYAKAMGNTEAATILEEAMQRQPKSLPQGPTAPRHG